MDYIGEIAGLSVAFLWAVTSIFFAEAGRSIGSFRVNVIRLLIAVGLYTIVLLVVSGQLFPDDLNSRQVFWLALSGLVGLVIGDGCGFKALVMIGPRLTTVMYSSAPIMATVVAWLFLDETLSWWSLLGIGLTITGITWVVLERRGKNNHEISARQRDHPDSGSLAKGVLLGAGAAAGQAIGLVMAKHGMANAGGTVEPLEASFIRMTAAMILIWLLAALRGHLPSILSAMRQGKPVAFSAAGAVAGPFLGVWMSLVAVSYVAVGVAATLNAMTPVAIIPLVILYYKEKVSLRATVGAIVAVAGVAILFLS